MSWRTFYPKVQSADNRVQVKKEKYILPKPSEKNNFTRHCCNKTWTNEKDYLEHLRRVHPFSRELHPEKKGKLGEYACPFCKRDFFSETKYKNHLKEYHPHRCDICKIEFQWEIDSQNHQMLCHTLACKHIELQSKNELQDHNKQLRSTICKCPVCDEEMIGQKQKNKHLHENHPAIYFCSFCNEPFKTYGRVYKHMIENHQYKLKSLNNGYVPKLVDCDKYISGKWTCIFCQKTFVNKDLYKQHYLEHIQKEGKKES